MFDNATGIGRRRGEVVKETELFARLRTHYGFEATFCNPASGNEKGNVENKVGFIRRNLLTPIVEITTLEDANPSLLQDCEALQGNRVHYRKGRTTTELFRTDKEALRELPRAAFKAVSYQQARTDRYGGVVRRWFWRWSVMGVPCPGCSGRALVVVVTRGSSSWWGLVVLMVVFVFSRC